MGLPHPDALKFSALLVNIFTCGRDEHFAASFVLSQAQLGVEFGGQRHYQKNILN